jgi:hypothetical protein
VAEYNNQSKLNETVYMKINIAGLLPFIIMVIWLFAENSNAADRQNLFDWYYSAVFGTGTYRINARDVFVITASYEKQLRPASDDEYQIMLDSSVSAGFYNYDIQSAIELEIPTDVATLTFFPGIYYVIPLSDRWEIKPYVNVGYGKEFEGGEEAWIYSAGIRSLYRHDSDGWRVALGNAVYYAGNTRKGETDLGLAGFDAMFDINHATDWQIDNQKIYLGGYAGIYLFSNLEFIESDQAVLEVNKQYEVGIALSSRQEFSILGVSMNRIGLGYLYGDGFYAWRVVFSIPY